MEINKIYDDAEAKRRKSQAPHRIGGNLKLLRESTNADRKRLKIAFSIANCRFRLPICNLKRCFNAYRSALLDSRASSRLPPIQCEHVFKLFSTMRGFPGYEMNNLKTSLRLNTIIEYLSHRHPSLCFFSKKCMDVVARNIKIL